MGIAEIIVCLVIIAMLVATVWDVGGQELKELREYKKRKLPQVPWEAHLKDPDKFKDEYPQ